MTACPAARITRGIPYAPAGGARGCGDVWLPLVSSGKSPVLLIHGGGWNAMAKEAFDPVASLFAELGRPVFNINYRLLDQAPWPACGDDCLAAGRFLLAGSLEPYGLPAPEKVLVCGGSAGGHLAMMTGLRLPPGGVEAILSLSGPSRIDLVRASNDPVLTSPAFLWKFFGREPATAQIEAASPASSARPGAPPLFCIHSRNDRLVLPRHSEEAAAAWHRAGSRAEVMLFDGPGEQHGLWAGEDLSTRRLVAPADALIRRTLQQLI